MLIVSSQMKASFCRISVTFVDKDGEEHDIKVPIGMSLLEAAHENDIELEGKRYGLISSQLTRWFFFFCLWYKAFSLLLWCCHIDLILFNIRGMWRVTGLFHLSSDRYGKAKNIKCFLGELIYSIWLNVNSVIQDMEYYNKLEDPTDEENDMLDLAFGLTETWVKWCSTFHLKIWQLLLINIWFECFRSRLGCQIVAKPELDGIRVAIPAATRNFAVDGYVPKPH